MSLSEDAKNPASKPPFGDQPTTPVSATPSRRQGGGSPASGTPLPALEDRYEILGEAGRGGMGIVYRARDRETGELVALKVLKPEIASDAAVVERFKNELRLARKITHKNVCRIHEFNRAADGSAYISMEFVDGDSLRHILNRFGAMGIRSGIRIAQQICAGLGEAHAQGVVHRDLKPENVMLDREGNVKVMDFGIARSLEAGTTSTTGMMGTPAYMAPEQAEGKKVDNRSDIYALGLVLYETFTGAVAFTGDTPMAVALKHIHEIPPAPREVEPTLPVHIEKAILKCLEKNPAKRFQSVDEVEAALTQKIEIRAEAFVAPEKEAEVAVPAHLAYWQRADWTLLASGALGAALFLVLFYWFHPASAMEVTVNEQQARQIAADALKKLGWEGEVGKPWLWFSPGDYYDGASVVGGWAYQNDPLAYPAANGMWQYELKLKDAEGKPVGVGLTTDLRGRIAHIGRWLPGGNVLPVGPPPDASAMAKMREAGQRAAEAVFGESVAQIKLTQNPRWNIGHQSWVGVFEWKIPQHSGRVIERFGVRVEGAQILELWRDVEFNYEPGFFDLGSCDAPPWFFFPIRLMGMALLALVLYVVRKMYRHPRSIPNLCLAVAVGLAGATMAPAGLPMDSSEPGAPFANGALRAFIFCIATLIAYAVFNAVLYYSLSRFPGETASFLTLFRERIFARASGLGLLRGVFAGAAFSGVWMVLLAVGGLWGKTLVGMIWWLELYRPVIVLSEFNPFPARVFPNLLIIEAVFVAWLIVALPISLFARATRRLPIILAALAALWLALGFSLAGAMVVPSVTYYVFVALQAIFFGWVFLRYGLLSTLSCVLTVEAILLVFPLYVIFQQLDPLPFQLAAALWFIVVVAGAILYFRPQLVASYRRVAAVFE